MSWCSKSEERTMDSRIDARGSVTPYTPYWLIVSHHGLRTSVFTIRLAGGEEVLPVFGHAEEAETFLQVLGGSGWQIRETGAGELVSVLFDRYASIRKIALDPLAPVAGAEVLVNLVSLGREDFVEHLTSGTRASAR
jgi:hypothetical protein